jgi:hypothetical protein
MRENNSSQTEDSLGESGRLSLDPQTTTKRSEHECFVGEMDGHYARTRPCDSNPSHAAELMLAMHWQALALHPPNVSILRRIDEPEAGQWLVLIASARLLDWIKLVGLERTKPWPPWPMTKRYALPGTVTLNPVVDGDIGFEDHRQCDKRTLRGRRAMPQQLVNTLVELCVHLEFGPFGIRNIATCLVGDTMG